LQCDAGLRPIEHLGVTAFRCHAEPPLLLFVKTERGALRVATVDWPLEPKTGATVTVLAPPAAVAAAAVPAAASANASADGPT